MGEWTEMTIGEVADVYDGPHATPKKTAYGPWFLSISSLNSGRLELSESAHLSEEEYTKWTKRVVPQHGDVLFSYETRLGAAALMPKDVRACLGRRMGLLRPRGSVVEPRFLLYYYLSPEFQNTIEQKKIHGATVDRIALADLPSWPIRLPSLDEQRAVSSILGALDDKIAVNERVAETSHNLVRQEYLRRVENVDECVNIAELGWLVRDSVQSAAISASDNYIALEHMPRKHIWLSSWESGDGISSNKNRFVDGDILFGKLRPYFHKVGTALTSGVCSTDILVVRSIQERFGGWLLGALSSDEVVAHASSRGQGTRMPRAKWTDLSEYSVPWPGDDVIEEFNFLVSSLAGQVRSLVAENQSLAELRDTLLPKLMSGEIRVRDAEKAVEEAT